MTSQQCPGRGSSSRTPPMALIPSRPTGPRAGGLTLLDPRTAGMVLIAFNGADMAIPGSRFWKLLLDIGSVAVLGGHGKLSVTTC